MKQDECDLICGGMVFIHPKRKKFIYSKWAKKGWWFDGKLTKEGERVKNLVMTKWDWDKFDGRLVTVYWKNCPPTAGVLEKFYYDMDDWYLYTRNNCWYVEEDDVAFIEYYPNPKNLWRRLNYLYWKRDGIEDRFHSKVTSLDKVCWKVEGTVGECFPFCQCKFLG